MSVGNGLKELVYDLESCGFTLEVSPDKRNIEITKPEELGKTVLARVNVVVPSYMMVSDDVKKLERDTLQSLLPPVFNYVLSYLANTEIELGELTSGKKRPQVVKDIITEDSNHIRQGMIETLIKSDKLMLLADVYGDTVCRKVDMLSGVRELGYQDSSVIGKNLQIVFKNCHVATVHLDNNSEVKRELDWEKLPEDRREELISLLKWYVETPNKFREITFSLLEQVLVSNLPKQYKWAYRDGANKLWAIDSFDGKEPAKKEIVCDVSLFKMITNKNPFPTYLGRLQ